MRLFDELTGGGDHQQQYGDFISRYEQGAPHEGITDAGTGQRYAEVAGELDPQAYHESARDAFANLGPDERQQYANQLHQHAQTQGVDTGWDGQSTDPNSLAAMTTSVHQQSPGLLGGGSGSGGGGLGGLLGGGGGLLGGGQGGGGVLGGLLGGGAGGGNPVMKAAFAGIAAVAAKRAMGGGRGSGLNF